MWARGRVISPLCNSRSLRRGGGRANMGTTFSRLMSHPRSAESKERSHGQQSASSTKCSTPGYSENEIEAVFIRLVRLGDTGGASRRLARRREFDESRWAMVQTLAQDEGNRLV